MSSDKHPLSQQEFETIYSKVPRLTVEIILANEQGVYLTKRSIEPCRGLWHLPGGTVRFGEPLVEAVKRIAARELGINVSSSELLGYIEYPSHYLKGLDSPVGIAFKVASYEGKVIANVEAEDSDWFSELPEVIHEEQRQFLCQHSLIKA